MKKTSNLNKTIYASVLLIENKILFWRISGNEKLNIENWRKDFYYSGLKICNKKYECKSVGFLINENDNIENKFIFEVLAKKWFQQWQLHEPSFGEKRINFKKGENKMYRYILNKYSLLRELGYEYSILEEGWISKDNSTIIYDRLSRYSGEAVLYKSGMDYEFEENMNYLKLLGMIEEI